MKASDLRIGNYLQGKTVVKVKGIYSTGDVSIFDNSSRFFVEGDKPCLNPIELTEEWLFKFGYRKRGCDYGYAQFLGNRIVIYKKQINNYQFSHGKVIIKYVHQLQNLYFALTGYELQKIEDESK